MKTVVDVHGEPIDAEWAAEFRGFFWGDGSIEINRFSRKQSNGKRWQGLRPRLRLAQRADGVDILLAIQQKLGGRVYQYKGHKIVSGGNGRVYHSSPACYWEVTSKALSQRVLDILAGAKLPHSKRQQAAVLQEFLDARGGSGHKIGPEGYRAGLELKERLSALREFHD